MEFIKDGRLYAGEPINVGENTVVNPTDEMLLANGWSEYVKPEEPEVDEDEMMRMRCEEADVAEGGSVTC